VVLAEDAAQIAAAEEDRARAAHAAQAVLLTEMSEVRRDNRVAPHPAQPRLIAEPIDLAQPRADAAAILEQRERALGAIVELARGVEREVGRAPVVHANSLAPSEPEVTRVAKRS
jgi:hypothetical protein